MLFFFLFSSVFATEKHEVKFSSNTSVQILKSNTFDNITQLATVGHKPVQTPWFIMFYSSSCLQCEHIIPIWEGLAKSFNTEVNIAAINGEKNHDIRDRFAVYEYPSALYFAPNDRLYYYESYEYSESRLGSFIEREEWRNQEDFTISTNIDYIKVFYVRATSPLSIAILIAIIFLLIVVIVVRDNDYQRMDEEETKLDDFKDLNQIHRVPTDDVDIEMGTKL